MSLKTTSLHQEHLNLNAKMAPFAGFDMPIQYGSVKNEVAAVRTAAGMFDVSHMGEFFAEGPDAVKFVDYLITNDFAGAEVGKAVYSPLCRENGTIIDDLIAYKISENRVLICVNAANIDKDWEWISSHKEGFDCRLTNQSEDYSLIAVQGPKAYELLRELGLTPSEDMDYYSVKEFNANGKDIILARTGYTGEDGFEVFAGHEDTKTIWNQLQELGSAPCGLAARDVLRLEVCYPLYGHELNDELTPLDTGLKWTVKLNKDSFIGKEFLSDYQPKSRLIKLSLDKGIPREDYPILNTAGNIIGKVTSGTMSPTAGKGICIGLVDKKDFPEDKNFVISIRNRNYEANYHTKPFISGGHK